MQRLADQQAALEALAEAVKAAEEALLEARARKEQLEDPRQLLNEARAIGQAVQAAGAGTAAQQPGAP